MNGLDLASSRIIVTGGGGRLGSRMVAHFSATGARVAAVVASEEEAARVPSSERTTVHTVDVAREASIAACFSEIASEFGGLDVLIHTVGMWSASEFLSTSQKSWMEMMDVNLTSTFLCFREAIRHMDGRGTLVAMSSRQGADGGVAEQAAYSASKAGVVRLIESVAQEYRDTGIRLYGIAPSAIVFDDSGAGVAAHEIILMTESLITTAGPESGSIHRAYGTA